MFMQKDVSVFEYHYPGLGWCYALHIEGEGNGRFYFRNIGAVGLAGNVRVLCEGHSANFLNRAPIGSEFKRLDDKFFEEVRGCYMRVTPVGPIASLQFEN